MKKKSKKYYPKFSLDEIQQLLDWHGGYFGGSGKLHNKLLRIKRKMQDKGFN